MKREAGKIDESCAAKVGDAPPQSVSAADPLQNVAMLLAYDGGAFAGWQIQNHDRTVQGALEEALRVATRRHTSVYGSGRTDAGVHALHQVANVHLPASLELRRLQSNLNGLLGPEIAVKALVPVAADFHARHRARGKVYRYYIHNRPYPAVFMHSRCWWLRLPLDVAAMRTAAAHLVGKHDFSSFRAKACAAPSPVRTLHRLEIDHGDREEGAFRIELDGTGFLQHMARIIVGTLVAVGQGRVAADAVPGILAERRREAAGATAPARGLHLVQVRYDLARYPELRVFETK